MAPEDFPARLLDLAWREMVRNSAHDSICACSVDEVVDAVLVRYAEAYRIADGLAGQALVALDAVARRGRAHRRRTRRRGRAPGMVEVVVAGEEVPAGTPGAARGARRLRHPAGAGPAHPRRQHGAHHPRACSPTGARSTPTPGSRTCTSRRTSRASTSPSPSGARSASTSPSPRSNKTSTRGSGARPDSMVRIKIDQPPVRRVLARVADVPGFGHGPLVPVVPAHPVTVEEPAEPTGSRGHDERARHRGRRRRRRDLRRRRHDRLRRASSTAGTTATPTTTRPPPGTASSTPPTSVSVTVGRARAGARRGQP